MSLLPFNVRCCVALAMAAAVWPGQASAQAPMVTGHQKIQFSAPSSPVVASNLNELSRVKEDSLQPSDSAAVKDIMEVSVPQQYRAPRPVAVIDGRNGGPNQKR